MEHLATHPRSEGMFHKQARAQDDCAMRFEELALQAGMVHWEVDAKGLYTYVSPVSKAVYGFQPEELVGKRYYYDLHPEKGREAFKIETQAVFARKGVFQNLENPVQTGDGQIIWVVTHGIPRFTDTGEFAGYRGSDTNITERRNIEEALSEKEKAYRELAERANSVILRWKPDGTVTYINEFGEKLFGFARNELLGNNIIGTIVAGTESSGRNLEALIRGIASNPDDYKNNENENCTKDGRLIWIKWNNSAIRCSNGTISEIVSIGIDISDRKGIEDALRESEATFRAHVENSFDVIFTLDAAGTFVFVSPAWERHFGYPVDEVMGHQFAPFVHPDDIQPCIEYLTWVLTTGNSGTSPIYRVKCADGSLRSFVANGRPYIDTKGQALFIGVGHDVTDQLRSEQERLDFERQLLHTQKLESLGVLAGGIAHDFNNLLQTILGNIELAALKIQSDTVPRKLLANATLAANRASELTNRLLAYSGKGSFLITTLNLNDLVNENATLIRTAVTRTVSIDLDLSAEDTTITGDVAQIQQVIMNLITNAAEAIETQPGLINISTGIQNCDQACLSGSLLQEKPTPGLFVYLEVRDNGIGMSEEVKQRIFEPFFTTKFTGRGLGMSAVLGIAKAHSGAIFLDSTPGRGTIIRILFPVAEGATAATGLREAETVTASPEASQSTQPATVLVVDDEKAVLKICAAMVRLFGFKTLTASDGADAVRIFRQRNDEIDLVLMDLTMPNMDGVAAMHEIRGIKPDVKVILSSGFNEQELDDRVINQKPSGFIRKPYEMRNLKAELLRVMQETNK